jgi:hypothetical protein
LLSLALLLLLFLLSLLLMLLLPTCRPTSYVIWTSKSNLTALPAVQR